MVWGAVIGAGLAIAQGVASKSSADKQAEKAKETARFNAKHIELETAESIRRMDIQNEQVLGSMNAIMGGSGVMLDRGGTTTNNIELMTREQQLQRDWAELAGKNEAAIVRRGGNLQSSSIKANNWASNVQLAANTWTQLSSSFLDYDGSNT